MADLKFDVLHAVSGAANLRDAVARLLEICLRRSGAEAGAYLYPGAAAGYFVVLATRGPKIEPETPGAAMIRLQPAHTAFEEISEERVGLLFPEMACFANVAVSEGADCRRGLVRLEWGDVLRVKWDRVLEVRHACDSLASVLERLEQSDSSIVQFRKLGSSVHEATELERELDDPRFETLLPLVARLVLTKSGAECSCVFRAGEPGTLVLEPNAYVGTLGPPARRLPWTVKVTPEAAPGEEIHVRAARTRRAVAGEDLSRQDLAFKTLVGQESAVAVPVTVGTEPVAVIVVSAPRAGSLGAPALDALVAFCDTARPHLWKALLYRQTKISSPNAPLLLVGLPRAVLDAADRVSPSRAPVLLTGETGTGKESLAHYIHFTSERRRGPFIAVNAAEIVESLAESQLFGHRKGAFTGAVAHAAGAFELAHGGTLFLDEIDHLNVNVQAKVLRAIEYGEIRPLGAREPKAVDVRIVAATNKNLAEEVKAGRFLPDLQLRVAVFEIATPPLREYREEIPRIARAIAAELAERDGHRAVRFTPRTLKMLQRLDYPGNVRELRNILQNAMVSAKGSQVDVEALPRKILPGAASAEPGLDYEKAKADFERAFLVRLVRQTKGNMTEAAYLSGLDRSHLYRMLRRHGLSADEILGDGKR